MSRQYGDVGPEHPRVAVIPRHPAPDPAGYLPSLFPYARPLLPADAFKHMQSLAHCTGARLARSCG